MLNRYTVVNEYKKEVNDFVELVDIGYSNEEMRLIAKTMLFIKKVILKNRTHYRQALINDMLFMLYSINQHSMRMFYTYTRSFIENFCRVILKLEDNDKTGVRNIFNKIKSKYQGKMEKEFISYIEGEYSKCCDVIHCNVNAELKMYDFYNELVKNDDMDIQKAKKLVHMIATLCKKCKEFLIYVCYEDVTNAFYNENEVLYFLVGERLYDKYIKN